MVRCYLSYAPGAVCGDHVYILSTRGYRGKSVYARSVSVLIQSCSSRFTAGLWNRVAEPPVRDTTCVSIHGRLLTIGGKDSNVEPITAIHIYNPTTNSWEVINHMKTPRWDCIAAVLPNNQLIVVGGKTGRDHYTKTDSVEFATIKL